jgi:CheY-like chemotaxis protein
MDPAATRVLLVDDEPALLKLVSAYLSRLGYTVTTANTTEKAWAEMTAALDGKGELYAVAVLDASMPGLPMPELAARMLRACDSLRVVTASGYPTDISELEAAAPGRVEFLHKPFTPMMLAATVRRVLGSQKENV